jgi:4-amino-4-deoxy-L-arabinose transferase-like glycosyltransferase
VRKRLLSSNLTPFLIALGAFLLRLTYAVIRVHRMHEWNVDISGFGNEIGCVARAIARGEGFSSPLPVKSGSTAWFTPVYPYLMAGVLKVFGPTGYVPFVAMTTLDNIFSALTCVPIYFAGKKIGGDRLGFIAALAWAVYPVAIFLSFDLIWYTTLSGLVAGFLLWATLSIPNSARMWEWAGYGILWGAELMTNAAFVSLVPCVFLWIAWERNREGRPWVKPLGMAALALVLMCSPWTVRNYLRFHTFIPLRSNLGLELWRYNSAKALPHPSISQEERAKYLEMGEIAYMKEKQHMALQHIASHPGEFVRLSWWRAIDTWLGAQRPFAAFWDSNKFSFRFRLFGDAVFSLLGLGGLFVLHKRRDHNFWPLLIFTAVFPMVYYITVSGDLYRHPIDPGLAILAAITMDRVTDKVWRKRSSRDVLARKDGRDLEQIA